MNRFKFTLVILLICIVQQHTSAQEHPNYLFQSGQQDSLYSSALNQYRTIYVQLPNDYHPESTKKYPVTFILDGEVFLPTLQDVHNYYSGGFIPEMIMIGISNSKNRTRDLTTSKIETKYGMPFTEPSGEGHNFLNFIEKDLIPYIDNKYPTTNYRTLIGHSYGGLLTIYTLLNKPQLFANYIAIDPSLDWDNQSLIKQANKIFSSKDYSDKSLYMSLSGQLHMQDASVTIDNVMQDQSDFTLFARSNIELSNIIKSQSKNKLNFYWEFFPKELHGTIPFPSIKNGLITLFTWYQMENTGKINDFDTPTNELLTIINHRAEKLQNHFGYQVPPYPEDLLNTLGYMNMEMQQLDKSKMYFEKYIQYYPNNANAYDSMADYYESIKDYKNALLNVKKAYALIKNDRYADRIKVLEGKL